MYLRLKDPPPGCVCSRATIGALVTCFTLCVGIPRKGLGVARSGQTSLPLEAQVILFSGFSDSTVIAGQQSLGWSESHADEGRLHTEESGSASVLVACVLHWQLALLDHLVSWWNH